MTDLIDIVVIQDPRARDYRWQWERHSLVQDGERRLGKLFPELEAVLGGQLRQVGRHQQQQVSLYTLLW